MLLLLVAFNKTTVARYDADRRGIQSIILARCPNLPDHFMNAPLLKKCKISFRDLGCHKELACYFSNIHDFSLLRMC
jgi:hypothetical protein